MNTDTIALITTSVAVLAALGSVGFAVYTYFVMRRLTAREGALPPPHLHPDVCLGSWETISPSSSLPVVAGDPDRLCRTCARFDLEEGQAMARQHGSFMMAAQHVPPSEMGAVATPEGEIEARDIPAKAAWAEFGLCRLRHEGIWGNTDAARRARMQDDAGVPGQFLENGVDCYTTEGP